MCRVATLWRHMPRPQTLLHAIVVHERTCFLCCEQLHASGVECNGVTRPSHFSWTAFHGHPDQRPQRPHTRFTNSTPSTLLVSPTHLRGSRQPSTASFSFSARCLRDPKVAQALPKCGKHALHALLCSCKSCTSLPGHRPVTCASQHAGPRHCFSTEKFQT